MMRRIASLSSLGLLCLGIAALAAPSAALAGTPVELRGQIVSHGPNITLGDVFEGVEGSTAGIIVAHAAQPGLDAVLDAGSVQIAARRAGLDWPNTSGFHRIAVTSEVGDAAVPTRTGRSKLTTARHSRANQALVYARNISAGEIVAAEDLIWSDEAVAPSDGVANPDFAIGKAARHALRSGAPTAAHDLAAPKVVKRDDVVAVVFEADGISLTLQAKAMSDASVGDVLEVVNPQSRKVIQAVCSGPGQAVVGPRAEEIRAENSSSGGQGRLVTASLR